jgi:Ca2+-binding EF-hand superfamily protein
MAITQAVFEAGDTDGSGFIELNEFYRLITEISVPLGLPQLSEEDALEVLNNLDANKDGKLSLEEFYVLVQ